jgi:hypothetical protein
LQHTKNVGGFKAPEWTPGKRHNTVTATGFTTVLDFKKGPGSIHQALHGKDIKWHFLGKGFYNDTWRRGIKPLFQYLQKIFLLSIADNEVKALYA